MAVARRSYMETDQTSRDVTNYSLGLAVARGSKQRKVEQLLASQRQLLAVRVSHVS